MLASSRNRRLIAAVCAAVVMYSLVVVAISEKKNADAFTMGGPSGSFNTQTSDVETVLTSTAAADYLAIAGSSPGLRLHQQNQSLKVCLAQGFSAGNEATNCHRNGGSGHGDATFVIEPGYSPDTDFQIMSGTQLPTGFVFGRRGGKPGAPAQNPTNLSGHPDSGTATARACSIGTALVGDQCFWPREARPSDKGGTAGAGEGPGNINCEGLSAGTINNAEIPSFGTSGTGPAHITMLTNDAGPVNRNWGPIPGNTGNVADYANPKGQLWDVSRQRWAYARWAGVGCAGWSGPFIVGNTYFVINLSVWVYKDEPTPGSYTLILRGTDQHQGAPPPPDYKTCGNLLATPSNPCNTIYGLALYSDMFSSSKRLGRGQSACGQFGFQAQAADGVTAGHTYINGFGQLATSGWPACPTGIRGVVADSGATGTAAKVYAYDSATGVLVNSTGAGTSSSSGSVLCNGGALPMDNSAVPAGPGPGSSSATGVNGQTQASYGCAQTVGNAGNTSLVAPGLGDGRYYIRTNTGGPSYKVLVVPDPTSNLSPRWLGTTGNGSDWNQASTFTPAVGGSPLQTGDGAFVGQLTNTVTAGTAVTGSVTRGGTWVTGTDSGLAGMWSTQFESTPTQLNGNGGYRMVTGSGAVKVRFEVADGVGNPNLVGWYSGAATPADSYSLGASVAPGALVTTNFTSGSNISGTLTNGAPAAGSAVYTYRNSDGQSVYNGAADASGNWSARVTTAASAYKVFAQPPAASNLQPKWYNLQGDWSSANLVSAPSAGNNMTLPAATAIQGYVKDSASAADINGAPVYAYNSGTGAFSGQTTTNTNGQGTGRYRLDLAAGSYKIMTPVDATHENLWSDGSWNWSDSTAVTAPATSNFSARAAGNVAGQATTLGVPTANYNISAYTSTGSKLVSSTLSDGSGNYSMKLATTAASGWQYKVRFSPPSGTAASVRWYLNQTDWTLGTNVTSPSAGINQDTPA